MFTHPTLVALAADRPTRLVLEANRERTARALGTRRARRLVLWQRRPALERAGLARLVTSLDP